VDSIPVSVVVPTRSRPALLVEAVESIVAQTKRNNEIILALSDPTADTRIAATRLSQSCGARIIETSKPSVAVARNIGIQAATSEWIAFLDDDDIWLPSKLERQVAAAVAAEAALVSCDFRCFDKRGEIPDARLAPHPADLSIAEALMLGNFVSGGSAALVRRSVLLDLGGFDDNMDNAEDHDMWRRIAWKGKIVILDEPLLRIRRHALNKSADRLKMMVGFTAHFAKLLRDTPEHLQHMRPCAYKAFLAEIQSLAREGGLTP
jgi:glycosyltransferase involved in cell wall biosynthesis